MAAFVLQQESWVAETKIVRCTKYVKSLLSGPLEKKSDDLSFIG